MANFNLSDYIEVNVRIEKFWKDHPKGRIETEIKAIDDIRVLIQAKVYRDSKDEHPSATGHAEEIRDASYINKTSAVENGETSAVGRALAILGYEIKKSVASKEEVQNAVEQQKNIKPQAKTSATVQTAEKQITEKQIKRLLALAKTVWLEYEDVKKRLARHSYEGHTKDMPKELYETICNELEQSHHTQLKRDIQAFAKENTEEKDWNNSKVQVEVCSQTLKYFTTIHTDKKAIEGKTKMDDVDEALAKIALKRMREEVRNGITYKDIEAHFEFVEGGEI